MTLDSSTILYRQLFHVYAQPASLGRNCCNGIDGATCRPRRSDLLSTPFSQVPTSQNQMGCVQPPSRRRSAIVAKALRPDVVVARFNASRLEIQQSLVSIGFLCHVGVPEAGAIVIQNNERKDAARDTQSALELFNLACTCST